jgi:beta-galactosidase/beta-glucuronidase
MRRSHWVNLNGEWEFGAGEVRKFDRRIMVPFAPQSQLSGIGAWEPKDVVWYRKRFDAPASDRLLLHFGAVDYRATVWVNGEEVARHEGGHTPFAADVGHVVREHDNELIVRAEDPVADTTIPRGKQYWKQTSESIFYTATTGIWQTVWLEPLPARAIESLRITPDFDAREVEVEIGGEGPKRVTVTFGGRQVGDWDGDGSRGRIVLEEFHTWSPEDPALYFLEAWCGSDHVASYFGLRKVETKDGRFWLNGRPYVQRLILDQGYFPGGLLTAAADDDLRRDIELAKSMGFNGARKHQKVEDPRWLYWTDTLGFLVSGEMPNFHEHSAAAESRLASEWTEAVLRDRDHPSIVAWAPLNESFGFAGAEPGAQAQFQNRLYRLTHELDGTRPVVSNDGWQHALTDLCTLHDYAGADDFRSRYRSLASTLDPKARPEPPYLPGFSYRGEPVIVSEFGGVALAGSTGFGWSEAADLEALLNTYRNLVEALMEPGPVEGFCYTQLTDIEQERNGLLTFDRRPKVAPDLIRKVTETPKQS